MKSLVSRTGHWFTLLETLVDSHTLLPGAEIAKKLQKNPVYCRVENEIPHPDFPEHYSTKQREKTCKNPTEGMWFTHSHSPLETLLSRRNQRSGDFRTVQSPSHLLKIASLAPCSPTSCSDSSVWTLQRGRVCSDIARRTSATLTRALQGTMNGAESTLAQWSSCFAMHRKVSSWAKMPSWIPSSLLLVRSPAPAAQPLEEDGWGSRQRREPPI